MSDLRPCPFCWSFGSDLAPSEVSPGVWAIVCKECGAMGPTNHLNDEEQQANNTTVREAIDEWNVRA